MTKEESNHRHDLKRNISAILAGVRHCSKKVADDDHYSQRVLEEMKESCFKALEAYEKLFNEQGLAQEMGV